VRTFDVEEHVGMQKERDGIFFQAEMARDEMWATLEKRRESSNKE
jgi:hypothetical protein